MIRDVAPKLFEQGLFKIDPDSTPDMLKRKREKIRSLMSGSQPRYVGAGLAKLATGIAAGQMGKQMDEHEATKSKEAQEQFNLLLGGAPSYAAPMGTPFAPQEAAMGVRNEAMRNNGGPTNEAAVAVEATEPDGYLKSLVRTESGGNWAAQNNETGAGGKKGHFGRVQFGHARLDDAKRAGAIPKDMTPEQFMASPELQQAAERWHFQDLENRLGDLVGAQVNGQTLDMGALVAMGHLGGAGGARKYVETGGQYNPSDSFGTSLADYARTHGGSGAVSGSTGPSQAFAPQPPQQDVGRLYAALQNPWLNETQRGVITSMIAQAQQANDPMRQIQLQNAQLQNQQLQRQMNAPAPRDTQYVDGVGLIDKATGEVVQQYDAQPDYRPLTAQEVEQMGLPPGSYQQGADGRITQIGGSGTNVTVNNAAQQNPMPGLGKLPGGQTYLYNPDGTVKTDERGVPMVVDLQTPEQKTQAANAQETKTRTAQNRADVVKRATQSIRDKIDRGGLFDLPEVGILGARLGRWGVNQEAVDVAAEIETLQGMVVFDRLEKLREASTNGSSGLGQVTNVEIGLLGAQLGALRQDMSPDKIKETLDTLDGVFGRLPPEAVDYLMGESDNLPPPDAASSVPFDPQTPDFSQMTDEELQSYIEREGR